jgi:hypothetical protein
MSYLSRAEALKAFEAYGITGFADGHVSVLRVKALPRNERGAKVPLLAVAMTWKWASGEQEDAARKVGTGKPTS